MEEFDLYKQIYISRFILNLEKYDSSFCQKYKSGQWLRIFEANKHINQKKKYNTDNTHNRSIT